MACSSGDKGFRGRGGWDCAGGREAGGSGGRAADCGAAIAEALPEAGGGGRVAVIVCGDGVADDGVTTRGGAGAVGGDEGGAGTATGMGRWAGVRTNNSWHVGQGTV
jgi:hypothetical protein